MFVSVTHPEIRPKGPDAAATPGSPSVAELRGRALHAKLLANAAARRLRMSSRTLGRRLADERITFKELVDDVRKTVALRLVSGRELGMAEIALRTGFTETPSFYRAFRRWTGLTPNQYRHARHGDLRGLR